MGCIGSHFSQLLASGSSLEREAELNRRRSVFPVLNVDELGRHISPGKLEVSESDLVLHMSGKAALSWPLRSLRRYGYDFDLFSFEAGRRCPTGAGIYAFKCAQAQTLFELLQARIQGNPHALPHNNPLPPPNPAQTATANLSPLSLSPTFDYVNIAENQQARNNNAPLMPEAESGDPLYMNVDNPPPSSTAHLPNGNLNLRTHRKLGNGATPSAPLPSHPAPTVLYTNLRASALHPELNYAELDLEQGRARERGAEPALLRLKPTRSCGAEPQPSAPSPAHTLTTVTKTSLTSASRTVTSFEEASAGAEAGRLGYATIDFDRTAALSVVTRAKVKLDYHSSSTEREEESEELTTSLRKTRHNSTAL